MNEDSLRKILKEGTLEQVKNHITPSYIFENGWTPLHYASANKNLDILIYLIEEIKMDPTYIPADRSTLLHTAAFYGNLEAIQWLIEYGIDPTLKDEDGHDMVLMLKAKEFSSLVPLAKLFISAHGNNIDACYELAHLYFSGKNPDLKKDFDKAIYYVQKGLNCPNLEEGNKQKLESLKDQIEQTKQAEALAQAPQNIQPLKKQHLKTPYTITDFFNSVKNFLSPSHAEDKERLLPGKKAQ